jgi:uncharacterized protein
MKENENRVKELDLAAAPAGQITRYWVHIVSTGMNQPVLVPVMIAKGLEPGPVLGLTAAIHGNELNGLPIIQQVFKGLDVHALRGTVVGVPVLNTPGFLLNQRYFNDAQDLNRIMPGNAMGNNGQVYAHRLIKKIIRHFEFLIDIHTASFGRVNSYYIRANMRIEQTARMAYLQNADIIVNNNGADGTLRSAAMAMDIPAITVEAGDPHKFQRGMIRSSITGIENVMADFGMIDQAIIEPDEPPVRCEHSYWLYTDAGGVLEVFPPITKHIAAGERIAVVRNVFGDKVKEYFAPQAGVVVGKSINPINQTGSRILHLGVEG